MRPAACLAFIVLMLLAFASALYLRYVVIQSTPLGLLCQSEAAPPWCAWRDLLIAIHVGNGWGIAALAGGIIALFRRWRLAFVIGLVAGPAGLVLYNSGLAAAGLVMSLLALAGATAGAGRAPSAPSARPSRAPAD